MMNQREKLIELLSEFYYQDVPPCSGCQHEMSVENTECEKCIIEHETDYLLANGVMVLPCKVGDTVWSISNKICKEKVRPHNRCYDCTGTEFWNNCFRANDASFSVEFEYDMIEEIGKTIFLTREEAERALVKRKCDNECDDNS